MYPFIFTNEKEKYKLDPEPTHTCTARAQPQTRSANFMYGVRVHHLPVRVYKKTVAFNWFYYSPAMAVFFLPDVKRSNKVKSPESPNNTAVSMDFAYGISLQTRLGSFLMIMR